MLSTISGDFIFFVHCFSFLSLIWCHFYNESKQTDFYYPDIIKFDFRFYYFSDSFGDWINPILTSRLCLFFVEWTWLLWLVFVGSCEKYFEYALFCQRIFILKLSINWHVGWIKIKFIRRGVKHLQFENWNFFDLIIHFITSKRNVIL